MVLCTLITAAVAYVVSKGQPKRYTATTTVIFQNPALNQEASGLQAVPNPDPQSQRDTNLRLLSLPAIASATDAALHIPPGKASSAVSVSLVSDTELASITATAGSSASASQIANTYAAQAIAGQRQSARNYYGGALQILQRQLGGLTPSQRNGSAGNLLRSRINALQILRQLQGNNVTVAQQARPPAGPSSPNTKRTALLGAALGLLIGIGIALLLERLDSRLRELPAVERAYGLPVLGTVPSSRALQAAHTTEPLPALEGETFAMLRARLRYFNVDTELRTLMITSTVAAEGKSTVALNLALAEAVTTGRKVLLMEADLRRPNLAQRLGIRMSPGLAEVISHSASLDDALQVVPVPGRSNGAGPSDSFSVLTGGAIPPNPAALTESTSMSQLLTSLAERFDLVIVDCPPLAVVSDTIPLVGHVDGIVIVTWLGKSTRAAAQHLRDQLERLDAPVLGVIANGVSGKRGGYGYEAYGYRTKRRDTEPAPETSRNGSDSSHEEVGSDTSASAEKDRSEQSVPDPRRLPEHLALRTAHTASVRLIALLAQELAANEAETGRHPRAPLPPQPERPR